MPERWQHELRKLRQLEPPDRVWERVQQGSTRNLPQPRGTGKLLPAVVAFAVFAVGAAFAWSAFGGGPATVAPLGSPEDGLVRIELLAGVDGDIDTALLRYGASKTAGTRLPVRVEPNGATRMQTDELTAALTPPPSWRYLAMRTSG
jgi:hypothetical protein